MLCKAICAFREPFAGGFVAAIHPGQEVEVPDGLVEQLVADGHIERPVAPAAAEVAAVAAAEEPDAAAPSRSSRKRK